LNARRGGIRYTQNERALLMNYLELLRMDKLNLLFLLVFFALVVINI